MTKCYGNEIVRDRVEVEKGLEGESKTERERQTYIKTDRRTDSELLIKKITLLKYGFF